MYNKQQAGDVISAQRISSFSAILAGTADKLPTTNAVETGLDIVIPVGFTAGSNNHSNPPLC